MRFDRRIELFTIEDVADGLGGHTEVEKAIATMYANVEELSLDVVSKDNSSKLHIVSIITFSTSVRPPKPSSSTDSVINLICLSKRIIIAYSLS